MTHAGGYRPFSRHGLGSCASPLQVNIENFLAIRTLGTKTSCAKCHKVFDRKNGRAHRAYRNFLQKSFCSPLQIFGAESLNRTKGIRLDNLNCLPTQYF